MGLFEPAAKADTLSLPDGLLEKLSEDDKAALVAFLRSI